MIDAALLLPKLLERAGANREMTEAAALIAWKRIAGEGLADHARPISLRTETLIVEVADDVWKKQLERMSRELTSRINKLLRREVVKAIEFRVNAKLLKRASSSSRTRQSTKSLPESVISSAAAIDDPELRDRFIRAATNCIDRREATANRPSEIRNSQSEI